MRSGYEVHWTDHANFELQATINFLLEVWSERELKNFIRRLDFTLQLISRQPDLFPESNKNTGIRRAVVDSYNTLYYRKQKNAVQILSLFSTRRGPDKLQF